MMNADLCVNNQVHGLSLSPSRAPPKPGQGQMDGLSLSICVTVYVVEHVNALLTAQLTRNDYMICRRALILSLMKNTLVKQ